MIQHPDADGSAKSEPLPYEPKPKSIKRNQPRRDNMQDQGRQCQHCQFFRDSPLTEATCFGMPPSVTLFRNFDGSTDVIYKRPQVEDEDPACSLFEDTRPSANVPVGDYMGSGGPP